MRIRSSHDVTRSRALLAGVVGLFLMVGLSVPTGSVHAAEEAAKGLGSNWQHTLPKNDVADKASLQRGARNFVNYCLGCHSLKYERWSRMAQDLNIPEDLLAKDLMPPGDKPAQYVLTSMPAADAETWFGKTPPDLSLMARARGTAYLYQFLTTFYTDSTRPTGANNLRLPATAMPAVLSELEGVKRAVYKTESKPGGGNEKVFDHFELVAPGRLTTAEYESFVRDTVNFLDYVGEPSQVARRSLGVWVVLFLLVFSWLAWLMKKEYWKDVH